MTKTEIELAPARLRVRRWQPDDLERLVGLDADPQVARPINRDGQPIPRERTVGVFHHLLRQWHERGYGPWAVVDQQAGRWLGELGLTELPDWSGPHKVEVGWEPGQPADAARLAGRSASTGARDAG